MQNRVENSSANKKEDTIRTPRLDKRLKAIADLVKKNSVVADIGTDHGYLAVYLAINNIAKKVFACDVAKKPLEQASKTIKKYKAKKNVETILSDGLENLSEYFSEIDTIILAGMGGNLISQILFKEGWVRDTRVNIIAQPMSGHELFRKKLYSEGFSILKEVLVFEKSKLYIIMNIRYSGEIKIISMEEAYFGRILENKNENSKYIEMYFEDIKRQINRKITGIKKSRRMTDILLKEIEENENILKKLMQVV